MQLIYRIIFVYKNISLQLISLHESLLKMQILQQNIIYKMQEIICFLKVRELAAPIN